MVNKLGWEGDNLNLVEPTQMNGEKRLEGENVLFCGLKKVVGRPNSRIDRRGMDFKARAIGTLSR